MVETKIGNDRSHTHQRSDSSDESNRGQDKEHPSRAFAEAAERDTTKHGSLKQSEATSDLVNQNILPSLSVSSAGSNAAADSLLVQKIEQAATVKPGEGYWQSAQRVLSLAGADPSNTDIANLVQNLESNNDLHHSVLQPNDVVINQGNLRQVTQDSSELQNVEDTLLGKNHLSPQQIVFQAMQNAATVKPGEGYWQSAQRLLSLNGGKPTNTDIANLVENLESNQNLGHSVLQPQDVIVNQGNVQNILNGNAQLRGVAQQLSNKLSDSSTNSDQIDTSTWPTSPQNQKALASDFQQLAQQAYLSLESNLNEGHGAYKEKPGGRTAGIWPLSQVMSALSLLPDQSGHINSQLQSSISSLSQFGQAGLGYTARQGNKNEGNKFFDDNDWVAMDLVQNYRATGNKNDLAKAQEEFKFEESGWDSNRNDKDPGGEFWKEEDSQRAAVSTGGAEQLALDLYDATPNTAANQKSRQNYLSFATQANDWMNETLKDPTNGLYHDDISSNGRVNKTEFTYNQGLMIGNETMLYKATGDKQYLNQAKQIADQSIAKFHSVGSTTNQMALTGIYCDNLELLNSVAPEQEYKAALTNYAEQVPAHLGADGLVKDAGVSTITDQAGAIEIEADAARANENS